MMLPFILIASGGLGIAVTTALEVVTSPYSAHVSAFGLNGPVHLLKVVAIAVFVAGMSGLLLRFRSQLGVVGSLATGTLAIGTVVGALPYSLVEASLDPSGTPAQANVELEALYAAQPWISEASQIAMPILLLAIIVFGVVALRRSLFPAWAPVVSLVTIPLAIGVAILGGAAGLPLPHPPAWIFLGLSGYGLAMLSPEVTVRGARRPSTT